MKQYSRRCARGAGNSSVSPGSGAKGPFRRRSRGRELIRPGQRPRMHRHGSFHVKHRVPSPCPNASVRPRCRDLIIPQKDGATNHSLEALPGVHQLGRMFIRSAVALTAAPLRSSVSHGSFWCPKKAPRFAAAIRPARVGEHASPSPSGRLARGRPPRRRSPEGNISKGQRPYAACSGWPLMAPGTTPGFLHDVRTGVTPNDHQAQSAKARSAGASWIF